MLAKIQSIRKVLVFLVGIGAFSYTVQAAYPTLMYHDPYPLYTVRGINEYAAMKANGEDHLRWLHLHISPFDQHASGARNIKGRKVTHGDRLGHWNPCGMFFGDAASPLDKPLVLNPVVPGPPLDPTGSYPNLIAAFNTLNPLGAPAGSWTQENLFSFDPQEPDNNFNGFMSVGTSYARVGLRSAIYVEPSKFFRLEFGFGFSEYSYSGTFNNLTDPAESGATELQDSLMDATQLSKIASEFGLDLTRQRETVAEDLFVGIRGAASFTSDDDEGTPTVELTPYVGVGFWIPTGTKSNQDKVFSLPGGNDGFFGYNFNVGLSLHMLGMLHLAMRGAVSIWNERQLEGIRVPSSNAFSNSSYQVGFIPWKTNITRKPGVSWDFCISACARHIIGGLSFYGDYIYGKHEQDKITLNEPNAARAAAFVPQALEEASFWKSQAFTVGMSYEVTPLLELGLAFQGHISGQQVFKTETLLGTVKLSF